MVILESTTCFTSTCTTTTHDSWWTHRPGPCMGMAAILRIGICLPVPSRILRSTCNACQASSIQRKPGFSSTL